MLVDEILIAVVSKFYFSLERYLAIEISPVSLYRDKML